MINRSADPRTADTLVYELLRTERDATSPIVIGRATFRGGRSSIAAPDDIRIAVEELLARAFVDRLQADERPRGYRRTGRPSVDMLVPGMAEHFVARMRGLWLSYPDGSVVTAREAVEVEPGPEAESPYELAEAGPPITNPAIRRATLSEADRVLNAPPLVRGNPPAPGLTPSAPVNRSDCGWLV